MDHEDRGVGLSLMTHAGFSDCMSGEKGTAVLEIPDQPVEVSCGANILQRNPLVCSLSLLGSNVGKSRGSYGGFTSEISL